MTANTSSRNYNIIALRGGSVTDQEYVETFDLDPAVAGTPMLNEAMLEKSYNDNIAAGVDEKTAMDKKNRASQDVKRLLAKNGMLK